MFVIPRLNVNRIVKFAVITFLQLSTFINIIGSTPLGLGNIAMDSSRLQGIFLMDKVTTTPQEITQAQPEEVKDFHNPELGSFIGANFTEANAEFLRMGIPNGRRNPKAEALFLVIAPPLCIFLGLILYWCLGKFQIDPAPLEESIEVPRPSPPPSPTQYGINSPPRRYPGRGQRHHLTLVMIDEYNDSPPTYSELFSDYDKSDSNCNQQQPPTYKDIMKQKRPTTAAIRNHPMPP